MADQVNQVMEMIKSATKIMKLELPRWLWKSTVDTWVHEGFESEKNNFKEETNTKVPCAEKY